MSCKEASLYLQSYFRDRDNQKTDQMAANVEQVGNVASITVSKNTSVYLICIVSPYIDVKVIL